MTSESGVVAFVCATIMVVGIFICGAVYLWWAERKYDKEHKCPNCGDYSLVTKSDDAFDDDWIECTSCGWYKYD